MSKRHPGVTHEGYLINAHPKFPSMKIIQCDGSGSVSKELKGAFTSSVDAKRAIDLFLTLKKQPKKRAADDKAKPASRSKSVRSGSDHGSVAA